MASSRKGFGAKNHCTQTSILLLFLIGDQGVYRSLVLRRVWIFFFGSVDITMQSSCAVCCGATRVSAVMAGVCSAPLALQHRAVLRQPFTNSVRRHIMHRCASSRELLTTTF